MRVKRRLKRKTKKRIIRGGADCTLPLVDSYKGEEVPDNKIWCNKPEWNCAKASRYPGAKSNDIRQHVKYLNENERKVNELTIGDDGKLYDNFGKLASTKWENDDRHIFVWGMDNKIFTSAKHETFVMGDILKKERFHHSSFLAGNAVRTSGYIKINNGVITEIDWTSGHYRPTSGTVCQFLKYLENKGIDVSNIILRPRDANREFLPAIPREKLCKDDNCDNFDYSSLQKNQEEK